ncbi:MAG: SpoIIIAC/SpoIIIAD family protein [Eubacterium sp.]
MILKLIGIVMALLLSSIVLKTYNRTVAIILSIVGVITVFVILSDKVSYIVDYLGKAANDFSYCNQYIGVMLRVLGIVLIGQFLINICKDNGENALASVVEIGTKVIVLIIVLPLFDDVIQIVRSLTK